MVPEEGVIVEAEAAMIQGIFGVGGEKTGAIHMLVSKPRSADHRGYDR